ncbi:hypothetical protein CRUP_023136 [Coryphaenoides rupestris]|nr:hypothetical protein CRUP_023136 [Coryphaenoides rupestris]
MVVFWVEVFWEDVFWKEVNWAEVFCVEVIWVEVLMKPSSSWCLLLFSSPGLTGGVTAGGVTAGGVGGGRGYFVWWKKET